MVWLGHSALGTSPLVHFNGNVNGTVYREKVLQKVMVEDVMVPIFAARLLQLIVCEKRTKSKGLPVNKRKLFKKNSDMIFEQDFAQPHCTNENQAFMEKQFPAHTPTLWRYQGKHELFSEPNGMIFGALNGFGQSILSGCIATQDKRISRV